MTVVTPTIKGQIVIPAVLRKKFGIVKGTPINIYDQNDKIILEPIHDDPIQQGSKIVLERQVDDCFPLVAFDGLWF